MTNCPEILISSAEYCPSLEDELAGIEAEILIWPAYTVYLSPSENAPFVISSKEPIKLPCIMQKNNVKITSRKGSMDSEIRIFIQNSPHNRGVVSALRKCRFLAGIKEAGKKLIEVFGFKKWETNQTMAKVKDDSVVIEFGTEFDSDKYIELVLSAVLNLPIQVNNFEFGDLKEAAEAFALSYNPNAIAPFNSKVDELYIDSNEFALNVELTGGGDIQNIEPITTNIARFGPGNLMEITFNRLFPDGNGIITQRIVPEHPTPPGGINPNVSINSYGFSTDKAGWYIKEFVFQKTDGINPVSNEYRLIFMAKFVMP